MHLNITLPNILLFILINVSNSVHAQIRIGLWEPAINVTTKQKSIFINPKEKVNGIDDDKNGVIDDVAGVSFTKSGQLEGKINFLQHTQQNNLTQHGWAVYQVLSKGLSNFKIVHAGFTPLTQHLKETGALDLSVEERKNNLANEYDYYKKFAIQTVAYFLKQKVRVVNMSFGTSASIFADNNLNLENTDTDRKSAAKVWMQQFLQSFTEAFSKAPEILFIVAAGNDGEDMEAAYDVPGLADLPNVICVGALNQQCQPAGFSNTGKRIDVYGIGEDIKIKDATGKIEKYSGTSVAVPIITNAAAKIWQKNKNLSAAAIKKILKDQYKKSHTIFCK
jgi:subtilisin family serine protease